MRKLTKALLGAVALPVAIAAPSSPAVRAACGSCRPRASKPCSPCTATRAKSRCNPCAAKNPCAANRPDNPCNPCAAGDLPVPKASEVTRPAGTRLFAGDRTRLLQTGGKLYRDTSLSTNGTACSSCHSDLMGFSDSFKEPYPHTVQMPNEVSGITSISAEGMVQFCLIRPMMSKPLPWDSEQLAALTAYVEELQKEYAKR